MSRSWFGSHLPQPCFGQITKRCQSHNIDPTSHCYLGSFISYQLRVDRDHFLTFTLTDDRLTNAIVKVGFSDNVYNATRCGLPVTAAQALPGVWVHVLCGRHIPGRYVFVQGGGGRQNAILTMCEVKILEAEDLSDCVDELQGNQND